MRALLALFALAAALAVGALGHALLRGESPAAVVEARIGDAQFAFAPAYARDEATAEGGALDRLAFIAVFPDFTPRPRGDKPPPPERLNARAQAHLFITLSPADEGMEPADRPARLYARFLEGETFLGPGGLVMRRFEQGSPYDLEQLYIAPPSGRDFFARCPKAANEGGAAADLCLWLFRVDGLDVELRFAPTLLEHWDALSEGARDFLASIRVANAAKKR